ncbi:MAG: tetratricopeptide repeat protein [Anaerolineae bacterium]
MAQPDFDSLWNYSQPAETEARFRELLPETSGDDNLQLLTQIARAQGLQRRFEDAHFTLDDVEKQLPEAGPLVRVRYLLERGRVFNSSRQPDNARPLFLEALTLAQSLGEDFYAVDAAHMLGIIEPPEKQLAWNLQAVALAERSAEPRTQKWLGSLYNNIGWTYHDLGQYEQALDIFQKALAVRTAQGQQRETEIAQWCVGRVLRSLKRIDEALAIQLRLKETAASDGYVEEEIGECLLLQGKPDDARPYFAAAYAKLSEDVWLTANEPARLERLRKLGND